MKTVNSHKPLLLSAIITALTMSYANISIAADTDPKEHVWQDRMGLENYDRQRDALEKDLTGSDTVEQLRSRLQKAGYRLTAINQESDSDIEYEVVKGDHTFEVKSEVSDGKLKDLAVTNNIWRADTTKRALKDADYDASDVTYDKENPGRYSDAQFADTWAQEKDALAAAMPAGKKFDDYKKILEDKGYQITSINDADDDEVEFEIVKGDHSFEVNLERDDDTKVVEEVEISNNIWHSEETEKALGED
ncbi:hypothetical protein CBP31_02320 [Oceanisphaera profunda]|uniref:PepSY domain-containing protein n=1 Tax=Oceanisphaera profunda TaxID=1416627 RepID=A0A1Y0D255_9GAMM|nr:hypothetical protein [Oceanisphaera profunda]ART81608.1 hypothetical protein CBP31_02320 [Oceanisphaera profunda]